MHVGSWCHTDRQLSTIGSGLGWSWRLYQVLGICWSEWFHQEPTAPTIGREGTIWEEEAKTKANRPWRQKKKGMNE